VPTNKKQLKSLDVNNSGAIHKAKAGIASDSRASSGKCRIALAGAVDFKGDAD
jgi:hypothetical protein